MRTRLTAVLPLALLTLLIASPSGAAQLGLTVWVGGEELGSYDATELGCVQGPNGLTAQCTGGGLNLGDITLDSWDMFADSDPVINGITAVTNNTGATQQFTLMFLLPIAPPVVPSSLIGGSLQGGVTDNTGDTATVSTVLGSSIYTALIDGAPVATLYSHLNSWTAGSPFGSANIPSTDFGAPIPSQAGPAALLSIGIKLDFTLTAGDSASFTSNFVVIPIPEPGTALLMGLGLFALAARRR